MTPIAPENDRRKFFRCAAALASWTVLQPHFAPPARGDDSAPRTIGLGFSLYGMRSLELPAAIKALAEIGYDCTELPVMPDWPAEDRKSTRLNSSHLGISYAVFCLKK